MTLVTNLNELKLTTFSGLKPKSDFQSQVFIPKSTYFSRWVV